jgi:hypothetical protein
VVFFAAPPPTVETIAEFARARSCGLGEARGFLVVEAASVDHLNSLAGLAIEEKARFADLICPLAD